MNSFIRHENARIHYSDSGKGNTIVLLHGFLESAEIWNTFSEKLSKDFRVVTIDLPGHGQSECIDVIHSMILMSDTVCAVLNHLRIKQCILIGHSMGGYVGLAFAASYPEKLKGFGLFHSHATADSPEAKVNRYRTIKIVESNKAGFITGFIPGLFDPDRIDLYKNEITELRKRAGQTPRQGIIAALEGMKLRPDRRDILKQSKVPVLFIAGKKDLRMPFENIIEQASLPSQSELLLLDDVGHMGFIEATKETYNAIHKFANSIFI